MPNNRKAIIILLMLFANCAYSQIGLPIFNLVRGTNSYTLGKIGSIVQDKYGYMWFADQTNGCFARYDGYHIKIFRHDPHDSNSTECKYFESITADASGNIWTGVENGIEKFDCTTNKFMHYRFPKGEKGSGADVIICDHKGILWMGGGGGLSSFDPSTQKFTFYKHKDGDTTSLSFDWVRDLYEDKAGVLWVGAGIEFMTDSPQGGLNKFNEKTGTFIHYLHDANNRQSLTGNKIRAMFEDSKGNFWVGTDGNGLHIMNREKGSFERQNFDALKLPAKKDSNFHHITFIKEDKLGKIWIGTYSEGIVVYDPNTGTIQHFNADDKKRAGGYTDNSTWAVCISRDNEIWISNEQREVLRVDPLQAGFSEVKMDAAVDHFLQDSSDNLWMALIERGLMIKNKKTNAQKIYLHNPADSFSISSSNPTFIQPAQDGQYWIGSWNGLNLFNPQTGRFKRYFYTAKNDNDTSGIFGLLETKKETYFGLYEKLAIQDNNTGVITYYRNDPKDSNSISLGGVINLLRNGDGNIWMSVWYQEGAALELFNTTTKKFKHYLKGLIVWDIFKSGNGKMWVGTSNGLYYRNDSSDSFIQAGPETSPLRIARIKSMTEDKNKNIWGVSSLGIFRVDPVRNEVMLFGDRFGTFDVGALAYLPTYSALDGEIYFGNPHGFYKCFPDNVFNRLPALIEITDFKVNGVSISSGGEGILKSSIEEAEEITLRHDQNKFSIDFAGIHFNDPAGNIHEYILKGYEDEWQQAHEEKTASYINVSPGHYDFIVKVTSSYGVTAEKSIRIIVLPPWWQTWWAYTLYVLLLALAIWFFIKWRTKTLQNEKDILENKVILRTKELQEEKEIVETTLTELKATQSQLVQSEKMASLGELTAGIAHEIQNPLNFVNNFSEVNKELLNEVKDEMQKGNYDEAKGIIDDVIGNEEKINHHGRRADAIVKGMLQHSRASTGAKEPTDLNALVDEYLRLAYHGLRAKDKSFNATMKTDFDNSIGNINIIPQDIGRVLLNLYNNAFYAAYARATAAEGRDLPTVSVSTKKIENKIKITVSDNGTGIPKNILDKIFQPFFTTKPTGQGTGLGLSMSYDIVKSHGGEIKVNTKENEGSEFVILLPLK